MKPKYYVSIFLIILAAVAIIFLFFSKSQSYEIYFPKSEEAREEEKIEQKKKSFHPDSIPAMSEKTYSGSDLKLGKVLSENDDYTRYSITYRSEGLKISGIMNIPKGAGPFPVIILNHGFIEPKFYTSGQGLKREQDFLAKNGYAVLHSDYRNYAQSDFDPENDLRPRSGYVEDVINAIEAMKNSELPTLDKNNIGMLGHSLGGGIALNVMVIKPDIAKAYALLAPINSDYKVNFEKWVVSDWSDIAQKFIEIYGKPEENPALWDSLSAKNYLNKISSPIILHQGIEDKDVPVKWSRELNNSLKDEGKNIIYYEYPGEEHTFVNSQDLVMQRTLKFFDNILKKKM